MSVEDGVRTRLVLAQPIETIEDAMASALLGDATLSAVLKNVVSFSGAWDLALQEVLKAPLPAAMATYTGGHDEPEGAYYAHEADFSVLVVSSSLRGEVRRRHADGHSTEKGAYWLVEFVRSILAGNDLDLDGVGELEPKGVQITAVTAGQRRFSVYELSFTASIDMVERTDDLSELAGLDLTYDVRDDDWQTEVATDTVELGS